MPVTVLGTSARDHAGVGDDDDVAVEPVAALGEQLLEVRRAGLLLALDEELQRDRRACRARWRRGARAGRAGGTAAGPCRRTRRGRAARRRRSSGRTGRCATAPAGRPAARRGGRRRGRSGRRGRRWATRRRRPAARRRRARSRRSGSRCAARRRRTTRRCARTSSWCSGWALMPGMRSHWSRSASRSARWSVDEVAFGRVTDPDDSLRAMADRSTPVVIVGAGLMGAATAWALSPARAVGDRRRAVRAGPPPRQLARQRAHRAPRVRRRAVHAADRPRVRAVARAGDASRRRALLRMLGGLDFGAAPRRAARSPRCWPAPASRTRCSTAAEARARWPGMRFDGDVRVPPAGRHARRRRGGRARCWRWRARRGRRRSAHERRGARDRAAGRRAVVLADGTRAARAVSVVVAAGGWVGAAARRAGRAAAADRDPAAGLPLPARDPAAPPWPSVIHERRRTAIYHLAGGRDGGPGDDRKIGEHDRGAGRRRADARDGVVDPASRERVVEYVRRWLPGLDPTPRGEATCLYTDDADARTSCSTASGRWSCARRAPGTAPSSRR